MILLVAFVYFACSQFMLLLKKYKCSKRGNRKDRGRKTLGYGKGKKNLGKLKLSGYGRGKSLLKNTKTSKVKKWEEREWRKKFCKTLLNQAWIQSKLTPDLIQVLSGPFTVCKMWWNRRPKWYGWRPWALGKHLASGVMWEDRVPSWPNAGL